MTEDWKSLNNPILRIGYEKSRRGKPLGQALNPDLNTSVFENMPFILPIALSVSYPSKKASHIKVINTP